MMTTSTAFFHAATGAWMGTYAAADYDTARVIRIAFVDDRDSGAPDDGDVIEVHEALSSGRYPRLRPQADPAPADDAQQVDASWSPERDALRARHAPR